MRSALYYPHTSIRNEGLVKTALLLWDRLEFIVPWDHFHAHHGHRDIDRAMELIGRPRRPNDEEKAETHKQIKALLARRLPPSFYFPRHNHDRWQDSYEVYPQKLLPETWRLLHKAELSGKLLPNSDYPMTEAGGLLVMSLLADACAGTTRSRVTDRGDAYATVAELLGNKPNAPRVAKTDAELSLVPIVLDVANAEGLDIKALIRWREREETESGHTLRDLRHRYVDGLEAYVGKLMNEKTTKRDAEEIRRSFAEDMRGDLRDLRRELRHAGIELLTSKEILVTILAGVGTVASWLAAPFAMPETITATGGVVTVGGLVATANKYMKDRRAIMQKHPMAYLYEVGYGRGRM